MEKIKKYLSKVFWGRLSFSGLLLGIPFFWFSLTPSLLPRSWFFQGLLSAISFLIGYGFGNLISSVYRRYGGPEPKDSFKHKFKLVFAVIASIMTLMFLFRAQEWQAEARRLVSMDENTGFYIILTIISTAIFIYLLLVLFRFIRYLTRLVQKLLDKIMPRVVANTIGAVIIIAIIFLGVFDVLIPGIFEAVNGVYSISDGTTKEGTVQSQSIYKSGSPSSLVPWDTLGEKGRNFTGVYPSQEQISEFTGEPAIEPIRAYVGLKSAGELDERVDLAIDELDRMNAWDREVMIVATTTGTGWLDPKGVDTIEYIWGGDTAIIGMQYSYLPSTISMFADQGKSKETASALFSDIYVRWLELPEDSRPKLFVYGLSLGSYGAEASFDGYKTGTIAIDGALLAGPTMFNELQVPLTDERDEGSPEWQPIVDGGELFRFSGLENQLYKEGTNSEWGDQRAVYLQHGTDPLGMWSFSSFVQEPDWMNEEKAPDVSDSLTWIPFVTGWQLTFDLPFASGVPHGHGHEYSLYEYTYAWADVTRVSDWSQQKTDELTQLLEGRGIY